MPDCKDCDSLHLCYTMFLSMESLINPATGKYHKLVGCDGESYRYGEEITKDNENDYARYLQRVIQGDCE